MMHATVERESAVVKPGAVQAVAKADINPYTVIDFGGVTIAVVVVVLAVCYTIQQQIHAIPFQFVLGFAFGVGFTILAVWWIWIRKLVAQVNDLEQRQQETATFLDQVRREESDKPPQSACASLASRDMHWVKVTIEDPDTGLSLALDESQRGDGGKPRFTRNLVNELCQWLVLPCTGQGLHNNGVGSVMLTQEKIHYGIYVENEDKGVVMYQFNHKGYPGQGWYMEHSSTTPDQVAFQLANQMTCYLAVGDQRSGEASAVLTHDPKWFRIRRV